MSTMSDSSFNLARRLFPADPSRRHTCFEESDDEPQEVIDGRGRLLFVHRHGVDAGTERTHTTGEAGRMAVAV
jgi:hypothetical protein